MRTSLLVCLFALLCLTSGVMAKSHPPAVTVTPPPAAVHQPETAWRLDASVVNQGWTSPINETAKGSWTLYKQCGEVWSNNIIGESTETICDVGCAMSSVAMALHTKGTNVNPGTLNSWLIHHGGYVDGDDLVWASVNPFGTIKFWKYYTGPGSMQSVELQGVIAHGWPVVVNVRDGTHWVLVTGYAGNNNYHVNDPGFNCNTYSYEDMSNFVVYSI